jgi:hypothetical protein
MILPNENQIKKSLPIRDGIGIVHNAVYSTQNTLPGMTSSSVSNEENRVE